jgi:hypothetical protein
MLTKTSALERVLQVFDGYLSQELARRILDVHFSEAEHERVRELSEKAQLGTLSDDERFELDDYVTANDFLAILQSKARLTLSRKSSAI